MSFVRSFALRCAVAVCVSGSGWVAVGQQAGAVSGVVHDPAQALVVGAQVSLVGGGLRESTVTDAAGRYSLNAPAGTYVLTVARAGFAPVTVNVVVGPDGAVRDLGLVAGTSASVTVNGNLSGSADEGYAVSRVQEGVLGTSPIVDQPYTITVMSADLIKNTQVKSFKDAMKFLPLVSYTEQQGPEVLRPATRGFQGSIAQNIRMDGLAMAITGGNPMEQYDSLQVENGLGGPMFGPANPSGMFNFVLKRPTDERYSSVMLEQDGSSVGTVYGDFGGRLGPHKIFGYRSNLLFGDGTQYVAESRLRRRLAEFAFDLRPTKSTTLDAHYSVYDIVQRGIPGWFSYGPATGTGLTPAPSRILPTAPDPTRVGFGQAYAGVNLTTQSTSARLLHDFSPNWHAMIGGLAQRLDRFIDTPVNTITDNVGDYSTSLSAGFAPRFGVESDLGYITGVVKKWGITQNVTGASEGYRFNQYAYSTPAAGALLLGTANVNAPKQYAAPLTGLPQNKGLYESSVVHQQGFSLSDQILFPKGFGVRLAASQDWIGVDNYGSNNVRTTGSNKQGISPSVSLMYKPTAAMTFYGTYASSLQQGDIAPGSANVINANQSLSPYRSKEWEVGYKTTQFPIVITTSLFRLERPFANTVSYNGSTTENVFKVTGQQLNYGAEISGQGTLFRRLTLDGGFTALNARLNDTPYAVTNGKRFVGIPPYHSNLYSEYQVPGVARLYVTGDWQFTGKRPQDDQNLHTTDGFNTFDFGFRYGHPVFTKMATLRFNANNVTNTRYYSTIAAGDITGTNASANTAHLGTPRTISSSLQITF